MHGGREHADAFMAARSGESVSDASATTIWNRLSLEGMATSGVRMTAARGLLVAALPLFSVAVWLVFHNPTIHGVRLNSSGDSTHVGDWTCLAPYDITVFHASNEYGGNDVADSDYARTHCNSAAHTSFAAGAGAGAAGVTTVLAGLVLRSRQRRARAEPTAT